MNRCIKCGNRIAEKTNICPVCQHQLLRKLPLNPLHMIIIFLSLTILGGFFVWYSVNKFSTPTKKDIIAKSKDFREIAWAEKRIDKFLEQNIFGFVKAFDYTKDVLRIKVEGDLWKSSSVIKRKRFIRNIARARKILGFSDNVIVEDYRLPLNYASFSSIGMSFEHH